MPGPVGSKIRSLSLLQEPWKNFLSIYTPSRKGARPVLVWIHGGAYLAGSGEEAAYDGSMLAEDGDIVVVTSLTPFRTPEDSLMY